MGNKAVCLLGYHTTSLLVSCEPQCCQQFCGDSKKWESGVFFQGVLKGDDIHLTETNYK